MKRLTFTAIVWIVLCVMGGAVYGADEVLESFDYPDVEAAREQWRPAEQSVPAELMERGEGTALKMICNFEENDRRAVYDMSVDWDLSTWHRFTLDIYSSKPSAISSMSLYFHSENGWYSAGGFSPTTNWNTIEISRSDFRTEDEPAGWHMIDTVRLAAWRGAAIPAFVAVDTLRAYREPIVMLMDTPSLTSSEGRGVADAASRISSLLRQKGIQTGAIDEHVVLEGDLQDFDLIICPYNPAMTSELAHALAQYIQDGGKVICFYTLPARLAEALHIQETGWMREDYEGQFAAIDFIPDALRGIPDIVKQHSWNIRTAEPAADDARVIGTWLNSDGERTEKPAMLLSDTGAFMSHIVTGEDPTGKAQMLFSLVVHFSPAVLDAAVQQACEWPETVGHLQGLRIMQWLEANRSLLEDSEILATINELHEGALAAAENDESYRAIELAQQRDRTLIDAYVQAHRSREGEFRAVWEHSGTGAYAEGWDKTMRVLAENGFNAIMPNTFWGGVAYHESEVLPVAGIVEEKGDQVAQAVEAGKKYGVQVHPWKVNFRLGSRAPEAFIERMRSEGRLQRTFGGEEQPWLCPSDPRNQELEVASMVEVATNYDVAGVHFDYIRYPGGQNCYCDGCRQRFEADTGVEIENWPQYTQKEGIREKWLEWRAAQITHVVAETSRRVHAARPECKVSAAVFRNYPNCLRGVGQDWVTWAKEGYVDFLCPMDYTNSDVAFGGYVTTQLVQVDGAVPVYPGIGASSSSSTLSPDRVAGQIEIARHAGTDGFIIFNYTPTLGDTVLPSLGRGVIAESTFVPHDGPRFDFGLTQTPDLLMRAVAVDPGQRLAGTVTRLPDELLTFSGFTAEVIVETASGRIVRELGRISDEEPELDYDIALQESGIYRIGVSGEATSDTLGTKAFTRRSIPVVVGSPPEDFVRFIPLGDR